MIKIQLLRARYNTTIHALFRTNIIGIEKKPLHYTMKMEHQNHTPVDNHIENI
jgi:hypothetical protein